MTDVRARIGYSERTGKRPYFYANAHEKDYVPLAPELVTIRDARGRGCSLDVEGFTLVAHETAVPDLSDLEQVKQLYTGEAAALIQSVTGCDHVTMAPMGILRFSERQGAHAAHDNSHPARFVHVDVSREAAVEMRASGAPEGRTIVRSAQYNVWRVLSDPPQDVPLGLCDYTSVAPTDLIDCDAIFDPLDGSEEWSFPNYLLAANPAHRWFYYPDMHRGEALIFKTSESDPKLAQCMPHGAFDNPLADPDTAPRISLEIRGTAFWFG